MQAPIAQPVTHEKGHPHERMAHQRTHEGNAMSTVPTLAFTDTPRTRRSDGLASHRAADRSQHNLKPTKLAVLRLVYQEGTLSGEEINDLYSLRSVRHDWPAAKHDTPRKRAGELYDDGFLEVDSIPEGGRVYCLSAEGREAIRVQS